MKKVIIFLCLVLCLCVLGGCKKQSDNESNNDNESELFELEDFDDPYIQWGPFEPSYYPQEMFYISKNVYTGKLLSFEYCEGFDYKYNRGEMNLTIEVDGVYKGDYTVGDIIVDTMECKSNDTEDFLCKDQRYLFMLGVDENVDESIIHGSAIKDMRAFNGYRAVKLNDDGTFEGIVPYWIDVRGHSIYTLFEYMFWLPEGGHASFPLAWYESAFSDQNINTEELRKATGVYEYDNALFPLLYESAENVYFGEIIELIDTGDTVDFIVPGEATYKLHVYKIKVKVMNVYKGDYIPGEIIYDVSCGGHGMLPLPCMFRTCANKCSHTNPTFIFTGGVLDCGYTLED